MNGANLDNKGYIFQDNNLLTGDTVVKHYLDWLKDTVDSQSDFYDYIKGFMENAAKKECTNTKQPFLSIITRTQGKRLAMLTEITSCWHFISFNFTFSKFTLCSYNCKQSALS